MTERQLKYGLIATEDRDPMARERAIGKLTDQEILEHVANHDWSSSVRVAAVWRIKSTYALLKIKRRNYGDGNKTMKAATDRLADICVGERPMGAAK